MKTLKTFPRTRLSVFGQPSRFIANIQVGPEGRKETRQTTASVAW